LAVSLSYITPLFIYLTGLTPCAAAHLAEHLRRLGESNAVVGRKEFLSPDTALAAAALYQHMFADEVRASLRGSKVAMGLQAWLGALGRGNRNTPNSTSPRGDVRFSGCVNTPSWVL
jgi:hypothetical protein